MAHAKARGKAKAKDQAGRTSRGKGTADGRRKAPAKAAEVMPQESEAMLGKEALLTKEGDRLTWPFPGAGPASRPAAFLAGLLLLAGALDALCMLPHPVREAPPGAPAIAGALDEASLVGLPAPEVRRHYHVRLQAWAKRAETYSRNHTLLELELADAWGRLHGGVGPAAALKAAAVRLEADWPKECVLAEFAVREREAARVQARLQGSAGMHLVLILRDLAVYRSLSPFTFEAMKRQRRARMRGKSGVDPNDRQVCSALVESSARSNKGFDEAAQELGRQWEGYAPWYAYVAETVACYSILAAAIFAAAYAGEVGLYLVRKRSPAVLDFELVEIWGRRSKRRC